MENNSLTILTNRFFALVLKSPIQMGWLSIINLVTNISRLGTFKKGCCYVTDGFVRKIAFFCGEYQRGGYNTDGLVLKMTLSMLRETASFFS